MHKAGTYDNYVSRLASTKSYLFFPNRQENKNKHRLNTPTNITQKNSPYKSHTNKQEDTSLRLPALKLNEMVMYKRNSND